MNKNNDTISRQSAIQAAECIVDHHAITPYQTMRSAMDHLQRILRGMPSAQPERKRGHWIGSDGSYICSECNGSPIDFINTMGASFDAYVETPMNYCPHCGADMRGEQDA